MGPDKRPMARASSPWVKLNSTEIDALQPALWQRLEAMKRLPRWRKLLN